MLGTMRINLTRDIEVFLANGGRWLTKDPVGNNVLLTTIAAQHAGHVKGDEPPLYAWAEDRGEILGGLRWPPPLSATLTAMPPAAAGALAAALAERSVQLPGANGPLEAVSAFCERWTDLTGQPARQNRELVISVLREVRLTQWPSGRMRQATESEAPVLAGWIAAVLAQAGLPSPEQTARQQIDEQLAGGRLYVWEVGGQLAAVTGHAAPAENVVLVHGGFASPDHRESWYGTAIVAAVCAHLLGQGYSCISITDRGNPHAGATLRAIGFEPTANLTDFQFGGRR
jgi:predicted GNAT family acetyltransferase